MKSGCVAAVSDLDSDGLVYIQWTDEIEEWKRESLTGSNVPYSPRDPRQGNTGCFTKIDDNVSLSKYFLIQRSLCVVRL